MMKKLRKGQTMVEYIIIVCLIAISLIAVFSYLSRAIGKKAAGAASALSERRWPIGCRGWAGRGRT